jgi:putative ABC transport system permease protein
MFLKVGFGVVAGIALGFVAARSVVLLLYDVTVTDPEMIVIPLLVIVVTTAVAALPAVVRAARIDPASMLRME